LDYKLESFIYENEKKIEDEKNIEDEKKIED
jgi:hypothetical protein